MSVKERGALLTVWLILMLVANIFTLLMYFFLSLSSFGRLMFLPSIEMWTIYVFCFLGAFNIVCVCFLFLWKKWAFFGLCGSATIALVMNLYVGVGFFAFVGLAGIVISYLVLRPKWNLLDNF